MKNINQFRSNHTHDLVFYNTTKNKKAKAHARLPTSAGHYEKGFLHFCDSSAEPGRSTSSCARVSSRGGGILRASATQLGHERRLGLFGLLLESGRHKQTLYAPSKPTGYLGRHCTGLRYQRMRANNTVIDGTLASLSEYDTNPCRLYQLDPLRRRSCA